MELEWVGVESWSGMEWSGIEWSGVLGSKLFQIVLAGPASKSLICPTKIDLSLRRFSVQHFSWLQNDQQDELHLQFFKISRKVKLFWGYFLKPRIALVLMIMLEQTSDFFA